MDSTLLVHSIMARAVNEEIRNPQTYKSNQEIGERANERAFVARMSMAGLVGVVGKRSLRTEVTLLPMSYKC